jgi:Uma2 family endonuclease
LVLEELNKIPIDEPSSDYRYEYFLGENSRYNKECRQHRSMYRRVGENLGKYIISTREANIVILIRVLAIIFTKYNREFCSNLWDPGGQSCKCIE